MDTAAMDKFMTFLPIIVLLAIVIVTIVKFVKKKYRPQSETISLKELKNYYIKSMKLILGNRIIIYIPLIVISGVLIIGTIGQIQFYKTLVADNLSPEEFNAFSFNVYACVNYAFSNLNYVIKQVFTSNTIFILLSALFIFLYPEIFKFLKKKKMKQQFPEYTLFKKVMILNVFIVVFQVLFYTILLKQYQTIEYRLMRSLISIAVDAMLKFFIISNYSFFITMYIQLILDKMNKTIRERNGYLEIAINKFPLMFSFNILFYLVIPLINGLSSVFFDMKGFTSYGVDFIVNLCFAMFITAPFLILTKKQRFSEVLDNSLKYFFRNFRVGLFLLSGLLGGAVLYFVSHMINYLWSFLYLSRLTAGFLPIFTIPYSLVFVVAFFLFLQDEAGKE